MIQIPSQTDYLFLVDCSASMKASKKWQNTNTLVTSLWKNCFNQKNDFCFFNDHAYWFKQILTEDKIGELFEDHFPEGNTYTELALEGAFNKHFYRQKKNADQKTQIFLFTDDEPDNKDAIIRRLLEVNAKLKISKENASRLTITIYQIGDDTQMKVFYSLLAKRFKDFVSLAKEDCDITSMFC